MVSSKKKKITISDKKKQAEVGLKRVRLVAGSIAANAIVTGDSGTPLRTIAIVAGDPRVTPSCPLEGIEAQTVAGRQLTSAVALEPK